MKIKKDKKSLEIIGYRYRESNKREKSKILDELRDLHGYSRKYLVQIFNFLERKKYIRRGRKVKEFLLPLIKIWLAMDQMCSKKLKAALPHWLPFYNKELSEETKNKLRQIHSQLDPFALKKTIEEKLLIIFKYVKFNKDARTKI